MRRASGFTLLELIVAIGIFAFVASVAYGGLSAAGKTRARLEAHDERMRQLQYAIRRIANDAYQLQPRGIRDVIGDGQSGYGVFFTDTVLDSFGYKLQPFIPCLVPIPIVGRFEVIKINKQ